MERRKRLHLLPHNRHYSPCLVKRDVVLFFQQNREGRERVTPLALAIFHRRPNCVLLTFPQVPPFSLLQTTPFFSFQDPTGEDRAARASFGREWSLFEASLVILAGAAPFLFMRVLTATSAFVPELGPTAQVHANFLYYRRALSLSLVCTCRIAVSLAQFPSFCMLSV